LGRPHLPKANWERREKRKAIRMERRVTPIPAEAHGRPAQHEKRVRKSIIRCEPCERGIEARRAKPDGEVARKKDRE